jgi:methionine-rich copper-binding protein CopC
MIRSVLAVLAGLGVMLAATAPPAAAHAELERAVPAPGSILRQPPEQLVLRFSQRFEPAFTKVRVLDADNHEVPVEIRADEADPRQLRVALPTLAPGAYRVHWRVLSVDTHVRDGQFEFFVRP